MSCGGKVWADVSWAMTGAPIRKLLVDARTVVRELKEMLEAPAKTTVEVGGLRSLNIDL